MNNMVKTVTINLQQQYDVIEIAPGVLIQPVKLDQPIQPEHKLPILIKLFDKDWQILNLAQTISQHYPVIINKSPKLIVYGEFSQANIIFKLTFILQSKKSVSSKEVIRRGFTGLIGLNIIPTIRRSKRLIGSPGSILGSIITDSKHHLSTDNAIKNSANLSEASRTKLIKILSILSLIFVISPFLLILVNYYFTNTFKFGYLTFSLMAIYPLFLVTKLLKERLYIKRGRT